MREIRRMAAAGLLLLVSATCVAADAIDEFVAGELAARSIPGLAVLVMHSDEILKQQGYGYANLEHRVSVTPDTLFQSGSTGKQFTAAGILLLAEDGKLKLDDPLAMYFPEAPAAWHRITIRHLLTHTSGLKDYGDEFDYRHDYTDEQMLAIMEKLPLEFAPGTQWSYSNSGYLILGLLTTKLAGKHWSEFQTERLFGPVGMQTTQVISERAIVPHRAAGYQLDDSGALVNQDWVAPSFNRCADGALYFSIRDLAAWHRALNAGSLMSAESRKAWWIPVRLASGTPFPYGFGWFLSEQRGEPVIEHGGSWQGFRAAIARYPEQRLSIAVLANAAHAQVESIAHRIAGLAEPKLADRATKDTQADSDALAARLRGVMEAWATYRVVPAMAAGLAATQSGSAREAAERQQVAEYLRDASSFRVIGTDRLSDAAQALLEDGSVKAVDTLLQTRDEAVHVRFRLDAKDRILAYSLDP